MTASTTSTSQHTNIPTTYVAALRKYQKKLSRKPVWMIYKAAKMVRKKHKTYAKYNSKNHPAYRKATKEAKREIKKAKREFEAKLAKHIKDDKKNHFSHMFAVRLRQSQESEH